MMQRSVPSGNLIIFWTMPTVPMVCTSSGAGGDASRSLSATTPTGLPERRTSSTSLMPWGFVTASGMTVFGKSTESCNGKMASSLGMLAVAAVVWLLSSILRFAPHDHADLHTVGRPDARRLGHRKLHDQHAVLVERPGRVDGHRVRQRDLLEEVAVFDLLLQHLLATVDVAWPDTGHVQRPALDHQLDVLARDAGKLDPHDDRRPAVGDVDVGVGVERAATGMARERQAQLCEDAIEFAKQVVGVHGGQTPAIARTGIFVTLQNPTPRA